MDVLLQWTFYFKVLMMADNGFVDFGPLHKLSTTSLLEAIAMQKLPCRIYVGPLSSEPAVMEKVC